MRELEDCSQTVADGSQAESTVWDLSDLYLSSDDPAIQSDIEGAIEDANAFRSRFKETIREGSASPAGLASALTVYEDVLERVCKPFSYARLLHASDSTQTSHGELLAAAQEALVQVQSLLMFFELDWIALSDRAALPILNSEECRRWKHFLSSSRRYRPHTLSEPEEIVLTEKSLTGIAAFRRLFDEVTSAARYQVAIDGESREMTQSEVLSLLYNSDRDTRKAAHAGFTRGLESNTHLATFILNTTLKDHAVDARLKKFDDPAHSRHLANEISGKSFESLMSSVEGHHHVFARYYRLKARLLGVETLYDYDRYAPIQIDGVSLPSCDWKTAQQLVSDSYHRFSPRLGEIVDRFLSGGWVDSQPRPGKRGGAFCNATIPSVHPYILVNFNGRVNDAMTLAHELGHGVHQYLGRRHGILQFYTPLTLAETASIFGEMLVFDRLRQEETDPRGRLALLCRKLEDAFATVFRQIVLTRFEQEVHAARAKRELSTKDFDRLWLEANAQLHGDAVELTPEYERWWAYIGHFIHTPFYCYAYAFGELLVFSLWHRYRSQGESFVPRYLELLSAGSTDSPQALIGRVGLDLEDPEFWNSGLKILEELLVEAEQLADSLGK